jgi:hypothetical protein
LLSKGHVFDTENLWNPRDTLTNMRHVKPRTLEPELKSNQSGGDCVGRLAAHLNPPSQVPP